MIPACVHMLVSQYLPHVALKGHAYVFYSSLLPYPSVPHVMRVMRHAISRPSPRRASGGRITRKRQRRYRV